MDRAPRPGRSAIVEGIVRDWRLIAKARGLEIPAHELDRIVPPLDALETAFRPLVEGLPPELEPATEFRIGEDGE